MLFIFVTFITFLTFFFILPTFLFVLIFFWPNTCKPARQHSNGRLCIGLQLQAQKLLTITVKFG